MMEDGLIPTFKSKITYENKTIFGVISIILGLLFWALTHNYVGLMDYVIVMIPGILLVIPYETIKNSKILGIITGIIVVISLIASLLVLINPESLITSSGAAVYWDLSNFDYYWNRSVREIMFNYGVQFVYALINLFGVLLFFVETPKSKNNFNNVANSTPNVTNSNEIAFCKYCGSKVEENSLFCAKCGKKL